MSAVASKRGPTLGSAVGGCVVAAGLLIGLRPLSDNSFFTHLATGRLILDRGSVPSVDPYTFSAAGEPWVVQSWLASWIYASVEAMAGSTGLRLIFALVAAAVAGLAWTLSRSSPSVLSRLLLCGAVLLASASLWAERPFLLGLLALGTVILAGEGRLAPGWLIPVGWLWVNTHGSFPLGVAYLVVTAAGARLDGERAAVEIRALLWLSAGVLLGAVGPLGLDALLFPVDLLRRQEILVNVTEWRAPTFQTFGQRVFLVQVMVAVVLLVRRPAYRAALPLVVFGALALTGVRNIPVASLVLVPLMAPASPALGVLRSADRGPAASALAVFAVGTAILVGTARLDRTDFAFDRYPVDATASLEATGIDLQVNRLAASDIAGNFRELVYGAERTVFYDDRFDMFPDEVTEDHLVLVNGGTRTTAVLDRYQIDLFLWERGSGAAPKLVSDPAWRVLYTDDQWLLLCRRGADLGGSVGAC